jgi:hypothetical protein
MPWRTWFASEAHPLQIASATASTMNKP